MKVIKFNDSQNCFIEMLIQRYGHLEEVVCGAFYREGLKSNLVPVDINAIEKTLGVPLGETQRNSTAAQITASKMTIKLDQHFSETERNIITSLKVEFIAVWL